MTSRVVLILLLVANALVLLGIFVPSATPPFAHEVTVVTLATNIVLLIFLLGRKTKK